MADVSGERPAALEDHFRIGSISKTFMATVMLQLVDEGLVVLDDTVAEVDPDLAKRHPNLAGITIDQHGTLTATIPLAALGSPTDMQFQGLMMASDYPDPSDPLAVVEWSDRAPDADDEWRALGSFGG